MQVRTHRPAPVPIPSPDEKKNKRNGKRKHAINPDLVKDYIQLDVYGIAPDDIAVANLVNSMSDHPLFEKVTMYFSRTEERKDIVSRRFHVGAKVPLDRRYLPLRQTAGVTHED